MHASASVFAGTRIRVATVQRYLQQGYETDAILNAFPDLRVGDVDEARRQFAAVGLARAKDDELTVWAAEHQAVIISTDGEFGQRRMQNAIGRHVHRLP